MNKDVCEGFPTTKSIYKHTICTSFISSYLSTNGQRLHLIMTFHRLSRTHIKLIIVYGVSKTNSQSFKDLSRKKVI